MPSISVLTTNVKTAAYPPSPQIAKPRKRTRRHAMLLPHYALHENAPTVPQLQQATAGVFARMGMLCIVQQMGGCDDH